MVSFAPSEYLDLDRTTHRVLFENTTHVWEALDKIANYLQFSFEARRAGGTNRQTVHRTGCIYR